MMKPQTLLRQVATMLLLLAFSFFSLSGCKWFWKSEPKTDSTKTIKPIKPVNPAILKGDTTTGCKVVLTPQPGFVKLYNCERNSDCGGKCMLQVGTPNDTNTDTSWRDIPGGNLNPIDVKKGQILRCVCRS